MNNRVLPLAGVVAAAVVTSPAIAGGAIGGGFNIDFGTFFGAPAASYGGAAGRPGVWQTIATVAANTPIGLTDTRGVASSVTLTSATSNNSFAANNTGTSGDAQALMDDALELGAAGAMDTFTIAGLANGPYLVYTYAWAPDNASFITSIAVAGSIDGPQQVGGAWPGGFASGITHAVHPVIVSNGSIVIQTQAVSGFGSLNGVQIIEDSFASCPTDVNSDGFVNVDDLVAVIIDWGTDGARSGTDINNDGTVDVDDLVAVILTWGPC